MNQNDQMVLNMNKQKRECPWSEADMQREPIIHKENKPLNELLFSQCYDQTYDLSQHEIKQWWELRVELFPLYDANDPNCVKRVKGLWYLLTETECQQIKNPKWTEFGFQQQDPTTDFRGGGIQSLDDIIGFVQENRQFVAEMCNPQYEFYFAASSINITYHLKKYFHLLDSLDLRDRNEVANRVGLKGFCHLLVKEDYFWQRLHKMLLIDLFTIWVNQRKTNPKTTILDFGIAQNTFKAKLQRTFSARLFGSFEDMENYYKSL